MSSHTSHKHFLKGTITVGTFSYLPLSYPVALFSTTQGPGYCQNRLGYPSRAQFLTESTRLYGSGNMWVKLGRYLTLDGHSRTRTVPPREVDPVNDSPDCKLSTGECRWGDRPVVQEGISPWTHRRVYRRC